MNSEMLYVLIIMVFFLPSGSRAEIAVYDKDLSLPAWTLSSKDDVIIATDTGNLRPDPTLSYYVCGFKAYFVAANPVRFQLWNTPLHSSIRTRKKEVVLTPPSIGIYRISTCDPSWKITNGDMVGFQQASGPAVGKANDGIVVSYEATPIASMKSETTLDFKDSVKTVRYAFVVYTANRFEDCLCTDPPTAAPVATTAAPETTAAPVATTAAPETGTGSGSGSGQKKKFACKPLGGTGGADSTFYSKTILIIAPLLYLLLIN